MNKLLRPSIAAKSPGVLPPRAHVGSAHVLSSTPARAQVSTLRLRLLKLGAWIETSVRRIVIHLPLGTPFADDWRRIARSVGAVVT